MLGASVFADAWPGDSAFDFLVREPRVHLAPTAPYSLALILAACIALARLRPGALAWSGRVAMAVTALASMSAAWFVDFYGTELYYYFDVDDRITVAPGLFAIGALICGVLLWVVALRRSGWSRIGFSIGAFWFFTAPLAGAFGDWLWTNLSLGLLGPIAMLLAVGPLVLWAKWPRQSVDSTQSPSSLHMPPAQSSSLEH